MNTKRFLMVAGAFAVATLTFTLANPKAVHAFAATLVQVTNTASSPVPTWSADNEGRSVVRLSFFGSMPAGTTEQAGNDFSGIPLYDAVTGIPYTVPAGKRLVIDNLTMDAFPPPGAGQKVWQFLFNGYNYVTVPAQFQGEFGGFEDIFTNSIPVRDYVDPGFQYKVTMLRSSPVGDMSWNVHAAGHLVDCTNGGGC